eukprot:752542-Hanusia_phi.AAC.2
MRMTIIRVSAFEFSPDIARLEHLGPEQDGSKSFRRPDAVVFCDGRLSQDIEGQKRLWHLQSRRRKSAQTVHKGSEDTKIKTQATTFTQCQALLKHLGEQVIAGASSWASPGHLQLEHPEADGEEDLLLGLEEDDPSLQARVRGQR